MCAKHISQEVNVLLQFLLHSQNQWTKSEQSMLILRKGDNKAHYTIYRKGKRGLCQSIANCISRRIFLECLLPFVENLKEQNAPWLPLHSCRMCPPIHCLLCRSHRNRLYTFWKLTSVTCCHSLSGRMSLAQQHFHQGLK